MLSNQYKCEILSRWPHWIAAGYTGQEETALETGIWEQTPVLKGEGEDLELFLVIFIIICDYLP